MNNFTPLTAIVGGLLIGLSASVLLYFNGRIAGVSGIVGGVINTKFSKTDWRWSFLVGLVIGAGLWLIKSDTASIAFDVSLPAIVLGGILTGIGTQISLGCTSGHGVCGIARMSVRSIIATIVFLLFGALTVFVVRHLISAGL